MQDLFTRSVSNVLPTKDALVKLSTEKKLRVYLGIDPTATRIHLGHAVALRKIAQFAKEGHHVTFLIGDFTALIGDTSDKESERPILTQEEIKENFKTYKEQAEKILDFSKITVRHNSEWLSKLTFADIVKLTQHFAVGDFVGRELIKKRLETGKKVGLHETLYPVMQGYDSYFLETDVQVGGADQTFNMLAGRTLIKEIDKRESYVLTVGYLEGTDGRKMSKTWGNAIWLTDTPDDMYGKVMSLKDELMPSYFEHATNMDSQTLLQMKKRIEDGEHPMELKHILAKQIVTELHSRELAEEAQENWQKTFQEKKPEFTEVMKVTNGETLANLVGQRVGSVSQAKRLLADNAIHVNGETVTDGKQNVAEGDKIQIGKKIFITVTLV
jgi:tyrosyl-tRNA synthetase